MARQQQKRLWTPKPIWQDQPCYIVGGGPSLRSFDWEQLQGRKVLGCNAAFYQGAKLIPITIFGDAKFLKQHWDGLVKYVQVGGWVITNSNSVREPPTWLKRMSKKSCGLAKDALGWNKNTGAAAINLALLFGANPIYLLGYDMQIGKDGKGNYHNAYKKETPASVYHRFIAGMVRVNQDLPRIFPGRRVVNLEDGTSALEAFPKESLAAHFSGKKEKK